MPRPVPKSTLYPVSEGLKRQILAAMKERGWTKTDLAKAVRVSRPAISILLSERTRSSKLVPEIHRVLGLPPPREPEARTALQHRWEQLYDQLDEDTVRSLLEFGEKMAKAKK